MVELTIVLLFTKSIPFISNIIHYFFIISPPKKLKWV